MLVWSVSRVQFSRKWREAALNSAYLYVSPSAFSPVFFFHSECVCVCVSDLQASQSFEHYTISDKAMDYRILHMDEDQDRMYVGCKDHVLSMDINNVTHGTLKVGTRSTLAAILIIVHRRCRIQNQRLLFRSARAYAN